MSKETLNKGLIEAARQGNTSQLRELINARADVNTEDVYRCTALYYCLTVPMEDENERTRIVEMLLNEGASVENVDGRERSALEVASADYRRIAVVEYLLNRQEGSVKEWRGVLHCFLTAFVEDENERIRMVNLLLEKCARVENISEIKGYALHVASLYGRAAVVELLLKAGVDVNVTNKQGCTALDIVCRNDLGMDISSQMVDLLMEYGANRIRLEDVASLTTSVVGDPGTGEIVSLVCKRLLEHGSLYGVISKGVRGILADSLGLDNVPPLLWYRKRWITTVSDFKAAVATMSYAEPGHPLIGLAHVSPRTSQIHSTLRPSVKESAQILKTAREVNALFEGFAGVSEESIANEFENDTPQAESLKFVRRFCVSSNLDVVNEILSFAYAPRNALSVKQAVCHIRGNRSRM